MVSSTLCPAVHILGSQNVCGRAEGIADHYWPWAVFFFYSEKENSCLDAHFENRASSFNLMNVDGKEKSPPKKSIQDMKEAN